MILIIANFFGLPVFLKITKGIVESPSSPKTKSIIVRRLISLGVLNAMAKSCRKIKLKIMNKNNEKLFTTKDHLQRKMCISMRYIRLTLKAILWLKI